MRHHLKEVVHFWPLLITAILVPVQTDALILFSGEWSAWFGISATTATAIVALVAVGKMCWIYWFWGWVHDLITDSAKFQRLTALVRRAAGLVSAEGLVDGALDELKLRHGQAHDHGKRLLGTARWSAYLMLFVAGVHWWWGTRGLPLGLVGITRWRRGLYILLIGSSIRTAYLMGGVHWLRHGDLLKLTYAALAATFVVLGVQLIRWYRTSR